MIPATLTEVATLAWVPFAVYLAIRVERLATDVSWLKRFHQNRGRDPDEAGPS